MHSSSKHLSSKHLPLAKIAIGERHRKDLGDIAALAASIQELGLLHPIVLTGDYTLIVGRRRLAAYEHLQRETIPALVIDLDNPLQAELDENDQRKDYTPSERVGIAEAVLAKEQAEAKARQKDHGKTAPGRSKNTSENLSEVSTQGSKATDKAAAAVGWSGPTYAKAKAVVDAAKEDQDFEDVVEQMDRTGNVSRAYRQLPAYARTEDEETTKAPRRLRYEALLQRLDHFMVDVVIEQAPLYTDEQRAHICASTHDVDDPLFQLVLRPVTIGTRCWVAAEAFVGPGVTMADRSVLGARAALFRDAEADGIYQGNPAVKVKQRALRG
jgi:ParB-like chromosome segregation protein Spo0J